jgi:hypothetical protein
MVEVSEMVRNDHQLNVRKTVEQVNTHERSCDIESSQILYQTCAKKSQRRAKYWTENKFTPISHQDFWKNVASGKRLRPMTKIRSSFKTKNQMQKFPMEMFKVSETEKASDFHFLHIKRRIC